MFGANSDCGSSIQLAPTDQQDFKLDLTEINSEIDVTLLKKSQKNEKTSQIGSKQVQNRSGATPRPSPKP